MPGVYGGTGDWAGPGWAPGAGGRGVAWGLMTPTSEGFWACGWMMFCVLLFVVVFVVVVVVELLLSGAVASSRL